MHGINPSKLVTPSIFIQTNRSKGHLWVKCVGWIYDDLVPMGQPWRSHRAWGHSSLPTWPQGDICEGGFFDSAPSSTWCNKKGNHKETHHLCGTPFLTSTQHQTVCVVSYRFTCLSCSSLKTATCLGKHNIHLTSICLSSWFSISRRCGITSDGMSKKCSFTELISKYFLNNL